jgi:hypothetical protein
MTKQTAGETVRATLKSSARDCLIIVGSLVGGALIAGGTFAELVYFNRNTLIGPDDSFVEAQGWRWACIGLVSIIGGGGIGLAVGAEMVRRYILDRAPGPVPVHYECEARWRKARRKPQGSDSCSVSVGRATCSRTKGTDALWESQRSVGTERTG